MLLEQRNKTLVVISRYEALECFVLKLVDIWHLNSVFKSLTGFLVSIIKVVRAKERGQVRGKRKKKIS